MRKNITDCRTGQVCQLDIWQPPDMADAPIRLTLSRRGQPIDAKKDPYILVGVTDGELVVRQGRKAVFKEVK